MFNKESSYSLSTNKHHNKENCLDVCSTSQVLKFQRIKMMMMKTTQVKRRGKKEY